MAQGRPESAGARAVLIGVAGRRLRELRELSGQPLRLFEHEQLANVQLTAGDELYLGTFESGRLRLVGKLRVGRLQELPGGARRAEALPPFWTLDFSREVPHDGARALRLADGSSLRFARESSYELHPAALLRPAALEELSAAALAKLAGPPADSPGDAAPASPVASPVPDALQSGLPVAPGSGSRSRSSSLPAARAGAAWQARAELHRAGLSNRAAGALVRAGFHTVEDIRRHVDGLGTETLLTSPGVGHASATEVEALLGLRPDRTSGAPRLDADTPINTRVVSVRSTNALRGAGALTLRDVSRMTPSELEAVPNLGAISRCEIAEALKRAGLAMAYEESDSLSPSAPDARAEEMIKMRGAGATLAEIGSRFGVSRERARQILDAAGGPSRSGASAARRDRRLEEARAAANSLLRAFREGRDVRDAASELGLDGAVAVGVVRDTASDRDRASRRAAAGRARATAAYTDEQLTDAVQGVAAQLGRTPTSAEYNAAASRDRLPSLPTMAQRFGSWNAALYAAGLQPTQARRPYSRRWTEDACRAAARLIALEDGGELPSVHRYEQLAAGRPDLPSSTTLRNRLGPWSAIAEHIAREGEPRPLILAEPGRFTRP